MEPIKQAVERAKTDSRVAKPPEPLLATAMRPNAPSISPITSQQDTNGRANTGLVLKECELDWAYLEQQRVVAHNVSDPRSKAFDILRTQVLHSMDRQNWHFLAVTSPTEGCGKTLTAVNLALSIARQPERSVVLVDIDLQQPKIARCLGLKCERGIVSMLAGRTILQGSLIDTYIAGNHCPVLPAEARSIHSSELIASRAFRTMLEEIKANFPAATVILDLPPVMSGDDVLSIMPYMDCFLLVAAVGSSTVSDIRECNKYLHSAEILRIVLNKAAEQRTYSGY
jgi:protein-tyrosine kinase